MALLALDSDLDFSKLSIDSPASGFKKEAGELLGRLQSILSDPKQVNLYQTSTKLVERLSLFIQLGYGLTFVSEQGSKKAGSIRDLESIDFGFGPRGEETQGILHARDISAIEISRRDPEITIVTKFNLALHGSGLVKLARHALQIPQPRTDGKSDPLARTDEEVLKRLDASASGRAHVALGAPGVLAYVWQAKDESIKLLIHPCLEIDQVAAALAIPAARLADTELAGRGGDFCH